VATHRVRLRDDEVQLIGKALKWFSDFASDKELLGEEDRLLVQDLATRFGDWGNDRPEGERPLYRRRRT